jgi:hypothetical protein
MEIVGEDVDREKRLTELRNRMDKFKKISVAPHERGFTGSSLQGKSIGPPKEYDDGNVLLYNIFLRLKDFQVILYFLIKLILMDSTQE